MIPNLTSNIIVYSCTRHKTISKSEKTVLMKYWNWSEFMEESFKLTRWIRILLCLNNLWFFILSHMWKMINLKLHEHFKQRLTLQKKDTELTSHEAIRTGLWPVFGPTMINGNSWNKSYIYDFSTYKKLLIWLTIRIQGITKQNLQNQ